MNKIGTKLEKKVAETYREDEDERNKVPTLDKSFLHYLIARLLLTCAAEMLSPVDLYSIIRANVARAFEASSRMIGDKDTKDKSHCTSEIHLHRYPTRLWVGYCISSASVEQIGDVKSWHIGLGKGRICNDYVTCLRGFIHSELLIQDHARRNFTVDLEKAPTKENPLAIITSFVGVKAILDEMYAGAFVRPKGSKAKRHMQEDHKRPNDQKRKAKENRKKNGKGSLPLDDKTLNNIKVHVAAMIRADQSSAVQDTTPQEKGQSDQKKVTFEKADKKGKKSKG